MRLDSQWLLDMVKHEIRGIAESDFASDRKVTVEPGIGALLSDAQKAVTEYVARVRGVTLTFEPRSPE